VEKSFRQQLSPNDPGARPHHSAVFWSECLEPRRLLAAQPSIDLAGQLDTSFGNGTGEISVPFGGAAITAIRSSILQPDGKTVIVGQSADPNGGVDFAVARINADGTPDSTFGTDGLVAAPQVGNTDSGFGVALQADGKIIVVGSFSQIDPGQSPTFAVSIVARLNTDGSVDTTFGNQGFIIGDFHSDDPGATAGEARAVVIQPDGDIVVGGGAEESSSSIAVEFARYTPDGTLDPTFATGGKLLMPELANPIEEILGEALQPDGSILAVGTSVGSDGGAALIIRLTPDGVLDTTFGEGGGLVYTSPFATAGSVSIFAANTIIVTPDGRLLAGGFDYEEDDALGTVSLQAFVARLLPDGSSDPTFGKDGLTETNFTDYDSIENLQLLPDGRILASGIHAASTQEVSSGVFDPVVLQFNSNGSLDTTFGTGGRTLVPAPGVAAASITTAGVLTAGVLTAGNLTAADTTSSQQQLTDFENQAATISLTPGGEILVVADNGTTVTVAELIGNGPALVPVVSGVKPIKVIGGARASILVNVQNEGNDPASGTVTVSIFLSPDSTVTSTDSPVSHISGVLKLLPGPKKRAFKLAFVYPTSLTDGDYFVVAQVGSATIPDAAPASAIAATAFAVPVAQPFVSFASQFRAVPVVTAKTVTLTLSLLNQGNVAGKGFAQLQLFASSDTALDSNDTALNSQIQERVQIKPNGTEIIRLRLRRTPGSFTGDDYILAALNFATIPLTRTTAAVVPSAMPILFS
jgi:uncharacterized delta-60 repeat protein